MGDVTHQLSGRENHVRQGIVLPLGSIQARDHTRVRPVEAGCNCRAEATEGVISLRAAPLREVAVLVEHLCGGNVIHAGVPKDEAWGLRWADILAPAADYDAQLAFERDLAGINAGPAYRLPWADCAGPRLDEEQRMTRSCLAELGAERMKV